MRKDRLRGLAHRGRSIAELRLDEGLVGARYPRAKGGEEGGALVGLLVRPRGLEPSTGALCVERRAWASNARRTAALASLHAGSSASIDRAVGATEAQLQASFMRASH